MKTIPIVFGAIITLVGIIIVILIWSHIARSKPTPTPASTLSADATATTTTPLPTIDATSLPPTYTPDPTATFSPTPDPTLTPTPTETPAPPATFTSTPTVTPRWHLGGQCDKADQYILSYQLNRDGLGRLASVYIYGAAGRFYLSDPSQPDTADLSYRLMDGSSGFIQQGFPNRGDMSATWNVQLLPLGEYAIELRVKDGLGTALYTQPCIFSSIILR